MSTDDQVGLLRWRDRINMEVKTLRNKAADPGNAPTFTLDVGKLKPITAKVGQGQEKILTPEQTLARDANLSLVAESIRRKQAPAQDKMALPPTSASEVGWLSLHHMNLARPYTIATHKKSEIVAYGEAYAVVNKAGPFDKTQPVAR
jgi:hypothetical protein